MPNPSAYDRLSQQAERLQVPPRNTSLPEISFPVVQEPPQPDLEAPEPEREGGMFRLEKSISQGIKNLCSENNISRDAFLEAAWLVLKSQDTLLQEAVTLASSRSQARRKKGSLKRAKTIMKNYS